MQLADDTLREGGQLDVRVLKPLVNSGNILLVAAEPVQRLSDNSVEATMAGVSQQRLKARASLRRTATDRGVCVNLSNRSTVCFDPVFTAANLIFDRSGILKVR